MASLQLKVQEQGRSLQWRPTRVGPWLGINGEIVHRGLTIRFSNGGGGVRVSVFVGDRIKPSRTDVLKRDGTYALSAKRIEKA